MHIELTTLSTMLARQDFSPIQRGELTKNDLVTADGAAILSFILGYQHTTAHAARYPTLSTVRTRFDGSGIEIPDPEHADADLQGLVHEVKLSKLRGDLRAASTMLDQISQEDDPLGALGGVITDLRRSAEGLQKSKHLGLRDALNDILINYEAGTIETDGAPWPWPSLHRATRGLRPQEFVVIAGRPKARKTFIALKVAAHAFANGARVLFVSPEMPPMQIMLRFVAFIALVRYTEFKNSSLNNAERARLLDVAEEFARLNREDDDSYSFRLHEHLGLDSGVLIPSFDVIQGTNRPVSWIQTQIEVFQPDILIVDSFYRLKNESGRARDADWKQVTAVSRALKDIAMDTKVNVIGTHQINRDGAGKMGGIENLALADAIGQDADLILRVFTGDLDGTDHSALKVLGGREVPFNGVLIRNVPCFDFEEVRPLEDKDPVFKALIGSEDKREDADKKKKQKTPTGKKRVEAAAALTGRKSALQQKLEAAVRDQEKKLSPGGSDGSDS